MNNRLLLTLGFDRQRLEFAIRTAVAAGLALVVAWASGLEHPQWSAMTVWAASQPVRGMLIEKSLFRGLGTLIGTGFGVALVVIADGSIPLLVLGLAFWVSLCAGAGNLIHGLAAYGTLLAGYSAAMVALLSTDAPDSILSFGLDRLLTVLVGVSMALLVGLLLAPASRPNATTRQLYLLSARLLHLLAGQLQPRSPHTPAIQGWLEKMAVLEEQLQAQSAGSISAQRHLRSARRLLNAQVELLLWLRSEPNRPTLTAAGITALQQLADSLATAIDPERQRLCLHDARQQCQSAPAIVQTLLARLASLLQPDTDEPPSRPARQPPVILHRDWVGARQAMLRASALILLLGSLWWLTDWPAGPYLLLGASVMITLFSTTDNPARLMRFIFIGQACGALVALGCEWLIWPLGESSLFQLVSMLPLVMLGALPMAHPRSQAGAMDFNMIMLLLLHPTQAGSESFSHSLSMALAVIAAPLIAMIAFRYVFPTNLRQRSRVLVQMMLHELQSLAASPDALSRHSVWQARLNHRVLHLLRLYQRNNADTGSATSGCLAVLDTGQSIFLLHRLQNRDDLSVREQAMVQQALKRLSRLEQAPEQAGLGLRRCAHLLARNARSDIQPLSRTAELLLAHRPWFKTSRSPRN
ncbi:FUSC family protein [Marinobacterium marinum]|uniref:FUSC family protein n=1 Tax=Marinobacterium marinum TaxID=2756129 RepID=A0A7W1WZ57_9GAMM|nr:FUSC family protein [Marinobacterium marinum]MBA4502900.1 FUSC family protein [Marinobacterium marinum]